MIRFLAILILLPALARAQSAPGTWERAADFVKKEVPLRHSDPFAHIPRKAWDARLDSVRAIFPGRPAPFCAFDLQQAVTLLQDDHTYLDLLPWLRASPKLPLRLSVFGAGYYVRAIREEDSAFLGWRLTQIERTPVDTVCRRIAALLVPVNEQFVKLKTAQMLSEAAIMAYFGWLNPAGTELELEDEAGGHTTIRLPAVSARQPLTALRTDTIPLYLSRQQDIFWFQALPQQRALYMQYNLCDSRELQQQAGNPDSRLPSFDSFRRTMLQELDRHPPEKWIIDLRFNPGGVSAQGNRLAQDIALYKKRHPGLQVFALIGPRTYSSAIINALDFQRIAGAALYGEATGGSPNHYGQPGRVEVPGTGLSLVYSTHYVQAEPRARNTLPPDVPVPVSIGDFKAGRDPVLERVLAR